MLLLIEKLLIAWADMARRGGILLAIAIVICAGGAGWFAAGHLKVNTDTTAMLDPNLGFQQRAAALREAFPGTKNDIVLMARASTLDEADAYIADIRAIILADKENFLTVFAPSHEPFFAENGLLYLSERDLEARMTQLSKAAGLIETLIKSPNTGTFFNTLADNDKLAERSDLGDETLQKIYDELAGVVEKSIENETRPFSWMGALDEEIAATPIHTRLLYTTPKLDFTRLQPVKGGVKKLREEIDKLNEKYDGRVETYITGDPALRIEELESVTTGIGLSMALSLVLVSFLLLICYRSIAMAVLTVVGLILTLVFTAAFAAAFVGELNLVSVAFTVLLIGLGLDFAIHLLLHIQERRVDGQSNKDALQGALHEVGPAIALAAPTTALAFLSFVPTHFDGIAQLGIIAGFGVIIAFFVSVTFLPAALARLPVSKKTRSTGKIRMFFSALSKYSGPIAFVTVIIGAFALLLMPQVRFDADQMSLRNENAPSVIGFNLLFEDDDTAPYRLTRLATGENDARETAAKANTLPLVASTRSLANFVPDDQDTKLELIDFAAGSLVFALDAEPNSIEGPTPQAGASTLVTRLREAHTQGPGTRLAAALERARQSSDEKIYERIEENIFAYWPQLIGRLRAQMNADYVEFETLPASLKSRYVSENGNWRVDILPEEDVRDRKALDRFVNEVEAVFPDITGGAYQSGKAGEAISNAMMQATGIAFTVVAIFLWLLVRRIRIVMLVLFPLALAAVLTAATGVLLDVPFNYANVIVLPLLIGIGVDSGIHLVLRHDQVAAGEGVYGTSTPRAVLFAALTTVASFGSLMLSPHRGTASMGELLSIAIAFTLICTLVVLPAVFNYTDRRLGIRPETQPFFKK